MELLAAALFAARLLWLPAGLLDPVGPDPRAPGSYRVSVKTTAGLFDIQVERDLAPRGADRFYRLVRAGYYDDSAIFRVISGYIAQFGIAGDPRVAQAWRLAYIPDDLPREKCRRGAVAFADKGPGTRATQVFINTADNRELDGQGFAPFGRVVAGMEVVDRLRGYGRSGPQGERTDQSAIFEGGNAYLRERYPALDYIVRAAVAAERR
jgi:peptidyl-prolyl cis-trans isomerase A (cyclophilin A)